MKYLITGGCGFLGSNVAAELMRRGEQVAILDNLSRQGSHSNREWLSSQGSFVLSTEDIRISGAVQTLIAGFQPDVVFHFAGQVAMTTSIQNPRLDFEVNLLGSLNVLEGVRSTCPNAVVIYSSTNKVYGDLEYLRYRETERRYELADYTGGIPETMGLDFHSPYGCSKGGADQYFLDYARMFGLRTAVFRHSSMYGGRQFASIDQGWVGWFCRQAWLQAHGGSAAFTVSGNGKQVRDILNASDMVSLYLAAADNPAAVAGKAFNVGGGMQNSLSILELLTLLQDLLGVRLKWRHIPVRESDQKVFIADLSRVTTALQWRPQIGKTQGIESMLKWVGDASETEGDRA